MSTQGSLRSRAKPPRPQQAGPRRSTLQEGSAREGVSALEEECRAWDPARQMWGRGMVAGKISTKEQTTGILWESVIRGHGVTRSSKVRDDSEDWADG